MTIHHHEQARDHQARDHQAQARARARLILVLSVAVLGVALSRPAQAHRNSVGYSTVTVADDRQDVTYRIKLDPPDTAEILGLAEDANPSDAEVASGEKKLLDHAIGHIQVENGEQPCPAEGVSARVLSDGERFIEIAWRVRCARPITALAIEYDLFFAIDPTHQGFLRASHGGTTAQAVLTADESRFVWELDSEAPTGHLVFLEKGVEHIVGGFDHIAFLLGLLLVIPIVLRGQGQGQGSRTWEVRPLVSGLRYTAGIVTSFTVAHSITLIAASLGWISLPGMLVESVIAASIIYVAVENIVKPESRRRYLITFAFGLIHGLGFAAMLQAYLPPQDVVVPLIMFNVGVELGQLVIVICVLPLLHGLTRAMGAAAFRARFIPAGSVILSILGLLWLIERVFEVTILGF